MGFIQHLLDAAVLSVFCFTQRIGRTAASGIVRISAARACKGYQKQVGVCPDLPPCNNSDLKIDCAFAEWGDWFEAGGCIGLCWRQRHLERINNEYGAPCDGPRIMSKACPGFGCTRDPQPCELSVWTDWNECASKHDQRYRTRKVIKEPRNGGEPCDQSIQETKPCADPSPLDCDFSDWSPWTDCSPSCGGYHHSIRSIKHGALYGGKLCEGIMHRTHPCNSETCKQSVPCDFTDWQDWKGCGLDDHNQKYRKREIKNAAVGDGERCHDSLHEVVPCHVNEDLRDCIVSQWSEWSVCDRSCDGGQTERSRRVLAAPYSGGKCTLDGGLKQIGICNESPCSRKGDCVFSPWREWGQCTTTCGAGIMRRDRKVQSEAKNGGSPCRGPVKEVKDCPNKNCTTVDCKWGEWSNWDACSATCGGGSHHRARVVITSPENGGKLCDPMDKSQMKVCATQPCADGLCVDGAWKSWEDWSNCSSLCDTGFRSRHREMEHLHSECGKPAVGLQDEYQVCHNEDACIPNVDCKLSEWSHWSQCSCECRGVRERFRRILQFASGNGKRCIEDALKEVSQCNPGKGEPLPKACVKNPPSPCQFGNWSEWGTCSVSCGGGQKTRTRDVLHPAFQNGKPCDGDLSETVECSMEQCPFSHGVDCKWSDWSHWTDCSRCGNQRYRQRDVVQLPNLLGKLCDAIDSKEVGTCDSPCEDEKYCGWGDWSMWGACNSKCGQGTKVRSRPLAIYRNEPAQYIFKGTSVSACSGQQAETTLCRDLPKCCIPLDCILGDWKEWSVPSRTQICERTRTIQKFPSCGGKVCSADLTQTKVCLDMNRTKKQDCMFGNWKPWSVCMSYKGQMSRVRKIENLAANGGEPCRGSVRETVPCSGSLPKPCRFSEWAPWTNCTRECGAGFVTRNRTIAQRAVHGGKPCVGAIEEKGACDIKKCKVKPVDCALSEWTEWSGITQGENNSTYDDCKDKDQQFRLRKIETFPTEGGKPCSGNLSEVKPCIQVIDCKVSSWSEWSKCDVECGGGQKSRKRHRINNPRHGGKNCPKNKMEVAVCHAGPCSNICQMAQWSDWGACSSTCGVGYQERTRSVSKLAEEGGTGCNSDVVALRACPDSKPCEAVDCLWSHWSHWGGCTRTCAGGTRIRHRNVRQHAENGGRLCAPLTKAEHHPCNTQPCADSEMCIDETWSSWEDWQPCTFTCQGGITWRTRSVDTQANECGTRVQGLDRETSACNADVPCIMSSDCMLSSWTQWTNCDQPCSGQRERSRHIEARSRGAGKGCLGPLKETTPCHRGRDTCLEKSPLPCELSDWSDWEVCSSTCDGGVQVRSREVVKDPANGGIGCIGSLQSVQPCGMDPCPNECKKLDCIWSDWSSWSACDKSGQRKRHRHVSQQAFCGGKPCTPQASEEMGMCTPPGKHVYYCMWDTWDDWRACPRTCGSGERIRERRLVLTTAEEAPVPQNEHDADDEIMEAKYQLLHERSKGLEAQRLQSLTLAFVSGALCLMVVLIVARVCISAAKSSHDNLRYTRATLTSEMELTSLDFSPRLTVE